MDDKILFEWKPLWSKPVIRVFQNRIEYNFGLSKRIIPITNISDVEQSSLTKGVRLNLNGGKKVDLLVPWNKSDEFITIINGLIVNK
jgi:hypothetical protein